LRAEKSVKTNAWNGDVLAMPGIQLTNDLVEKAHQLTEALCTTDDVKAPNYTGVSKRSLNQLLTARSYQRNLALEDYKRLHHCPMCLNSIENIHLNNPNATTSIQQARKKRQRISEDEDQPG